MRLRIYISALLVMATGCGPAATETRGTVADTGAAVATAITTASLTAAEPTVGPVSQPVWTGFDSMQAYSGDVTAVAPQPVDVYASPDSPEPWTTLEATTILGTTTVLAVLSGPVNGWVEVMLPVRPNGSTGWVRTDGLLFYVVDGEIIVDLSDRTLSYLVDEMEVLTTDIGIGSDYNQTPTGHFFVTDSVTLANPNSPWGPYALGLSARSTSITEFNGGDGIIGIHGTNNPGSVGDNISLGCIRLPNDMITALHQMVPIGTRVRIKT